MGLPPVIQPVAAPNQQVLLDIKPPAYVSFSAEVVPQTIEVLLGAVANLVNQGHTEIHLLLSSPGGSVMHGITAYNFLRALPIKLVTHNIGNVDSIGTVLYLAGEERYASPHTTFMLHGVAMTAQAATSFFERNLAEKLASVQADQARIKGIYTERSNITEAEAEGYFLGEITLNSADALQRGLVHEVRQLSIPAGSPVLQLVFNRQ
ncbi:ATP-dependent Clp protease proteolytic subunit [Granulicella paludicola]|uniref:ATP-dependent Clp protease proteolytic subunit n=1 Tax=Granulicella paludicola TaxID=474951 RepID=UPI0021E08ABD|nr:ATP-dependent Clp protease proteolytic subunit [Granulicella paludicola]